MIEIDVLSGRTKSFARPVRREETHWAILALLAIGAVCVLACAPQWRPWSPGSEAPSAVSALAAPSTVAQVDPPPDAVSLTPDSGGSVFVVTKSGRTGCQITATQVGCQVGFTVPTPMVDGTPANGVVVKPDGAWSWVIGDMGDVHFTALSYGTTYRALGWTIHPTSDGTRFTNDGTGRGIFVSTEGVESF